MSRFAHPYPLVLVGGGVVMYAIGPNLIAASSLDGPSFLLLRLAMGLPIMVAVVMLSRRRARVHAVSASGRRFQVAWLWTVLAGLAFAAHQLCFMTAVKRTSVADTTLLDTLSPVIVMLLAVPMFGERPTRRFVSWSAVAMSGAVLIALAGASGPSGDTVGMGLAGASVIFFALFFLYSKAARPKSDVWPFLLIVIIIANLSIISYFAITKTSLPVPSKTDFVLAFALAIGPGTLGHYLMTWPLAVLPANLPPVLKLLTPFLASAIAWLTLAQPVQPYQVAGGLITSVGVLGALLTSRTPRKRRAKGPDITAPAAPGLTDSY